MRLGLIILQRRPRKLTHLGGFREHGGVVGASICGDGPGEKAGAVRGGEVQVDLDDVQQQFPAGKNMLGQSIHPRKKGKQAREVSAEESYRQIWI